MMSSIQPLLQNENFSPFWEIKILLVEGNPVVSRLVEKVMEKAPIRHFMRRINHLDDLQFELRYNRPDVVITGRTMTDFSALSVLEQVSLYTPGLPVLVLAPDYQPAQSLALAQCGAYDIVYHNEIKRLPLELGFLYGRIAQEKFGVVH